MSPITSYFLFLELPRIVFVAIWAATIALIFFVLVQYFKNQNH